MTTVNELGMTTAEDELPEVVVPKNPMTADEFETWAIEQDCARCEWVEGKVIVMAPVSDVHNDLNRWLVTLFSLFVDDRDLGISRYDVLIRMPGRRRVPDIFVVKKENLDRITPNALNGPADLVMEIVSRDSGKRDRREKFAEYEAVGVSEYWIIDPAKKAVECYALGDDRRFHLTQEKDDRIHSSVLPGFYLRPSWLWQQPLPRTIGVLREMGVDL